MPAFPLAGAGAPGEKAAEDPSAASTLLSHCVRLRTRSVVVMPRATLSIAVTAPTCHQKQVNWHK